MKNREHRRNIFVTAPSKNKEGSRITTTRYANRFPVMAFFLNTDSLCLHQHKHLQSSCWDMCVRNLVVATCWLHSRILDWTIFPAFTYHDIDQSVLKYDFIVLFCDWIFLYLWTGRIEWSLIYASFRNGIQRVRHIKWLADKE